LKYRNVIENRKSLTASLKATDKAQNEPNNINSLVKLLGLGVSASIPEIKDGKTNLQLEYITKQLEQVTAKLPTIESTSQSIFSDQIHNELLTASNLDDKVAIQVFRNELNLILSLPASYTDKIESLENLEERISKRLDQNKSGTRISRITLLKRIKDEIQNLQT